MVSREHAAAAGAADPYRPLRWVVALYAVTAVAVALQRTMFPPPENNLLIFRAAFHHLLAGLNLYAAYPTEHADFFKYSPTFALLYAPFAMLPLVPGAVLWALACAAAVVAGTTRVLPPRRAALALAIGWLAVVGDLQRAQSNVLCAGLIMLGWAAMERRQHASAAAAIVAGVFVKLFPVAALSGAIFHPRKWRFAAVVAGAVVVGVLLPLLFVPAGSLGAQYRAWRAIEAHDAVPLAAYGTGGGEVYAGLMGLMRVWFGLQWPFWPTQLAGIVLLLAPLARGPAAWTSTFRRTFLCSILVFCVLFNHQAESPTYSIAMIGAAIWYAAGDRHWWRTALIIACLVVVNLASTPVLPASLYHAYYVKYLLKTVPLIPLWIVMQGELFGLIPSGGLEDVEAHQGDLRAANPVG
jgi:Glycosyltransferase family 87